MRAFDEVPRGERIESTHAPRARAPRRRRRARRGRRARTGSRTHRPPWSGAYHRSTPIPSVGARRRVGRSVPKPPSRRMRFASGRCIENFHDSKTCARSASKPATGARVPRHAPDGFSLDRLREGREDPARRAPGRSHTRAHVGNIRGSWGGAGIIRSATTSASTTSPPGRRASRPAAVRSSSGRTGVSTARRRGRRAAKASSSDEFLSTRSGKPRGCSFSPSASTSITPRRPT